MNWQESTRREAHAEALSYRREVEAKEAQAKRLRGAQKRLYKRLKDEVVDPAYAAGVKEAYAARARPGQELLLLTAARSTPAEEQQLIDRWLKCEKLKVVTTGSQDACEAKQEAVEKKTWDRWKSYDNMKASSQQTMEMLKAREAMLDKEIETVEASNARLESHLAEGGSA